jgi:hypothetical protein
MSMSPVDSDDDKYCYNDQQLELFSQDEKAITSLPPYLSCLLNSMHLSAGMGVSAPERSSVESSAESEAYRFGSRKDTFSECLFF